MMSPSNESHQKPKAIKEETPEAKRDTRRQTPKKDDSPPKSPDSPVYIEESATPLVPEAKGEFFSHMKANFARITFFLSELSVIFLS